MVGNLINTRDGVIEVGKIHRDSVGDKWGTIHFDDEIGGIEVTKELLKKMGFEKDSTAGEPWEFWRYWDKEYRYKLEVYPDELYCNSERKFGLHIDNDVCNTIGRGEFTYLHELMNLVRVITGYELKIDKETFYENE